MNTKIRKIIAITALIFFIVFLVSFMMYLIDKTMLNGSVLYIVIVTGCIAIGLYLAIVIDNKYGKEAQNKRVEEFLKAQKEEEQKTSEEIATEEVAEEIKLDIVKEESEETK